jgi:chromosome partitioning protein
MKQMKIIVPTNNKGGVGKTKVSILLAEYFSKVKAKRVLAIDFDPQCNFSNRFIRMEVDPNAPQGMVPPLHPDYNPNDPEEDPEWSGRSSISGIFLDKPVIPYPTYISNLDLAPAYAEELYLAEMQTRQEIVEKVHYRLHQFLSTRDVQDAYEIIIVDTAPSKGPLTISAIKAATHIIIPSSMEVQPVQGIFGMLQLWMEESLNREPERPIELIGILPNMVRPVALHKDIYDDLKENKSISKYIMPIKLGMRTAFAQVDAETAMPKSVFDLPDGNAAKQEALHMCEYVEQKVFKDD